MAELALEPTKYNGWIKLVSIAVPLVVAALFGVRIDGYDLSFLPPIYAGINAVTAVTLLAALFAIKRGKRKAHERLMQVCVALSATFLVLYIAYHMTSDPTPYGGDGALRSVYFTLLVSHILLSIFVLPLVLSTYVRAYVGNFAGHRKLAKITYPLWLYVTVSGVVVYLMIAPFYGS